MSIKKSKNKKKNLTKIYKITGQIFITLFTLLCVLWAGSFFSFSNPSRPTQILSLQFIHFYRKSNN